MSLDIALAASARDWPDRVHRHVLDHGGARVVGRIMGAGEATEIAYDALLIDDVCSYLTPRLVSTLRGEGREVIGVYSPDDGPDAKRHLLECGISDVIESDASAEEFLDQVSGLLANRVAAPAPAPPVTRTSRVPVVGVIGASVGVGVTEVAIGLAAALSPIDVVLADLDPSRASLAQRLGMAPHPNLRSAVDGVLFRRDDPIPTQDHNGMRVIVGLATGDLGPPVPHPELSMLLDDIGAESQAVVVDLGVFDRAPRALLRGFDSLLLVGLGDPVGIGRLISARAWLGELVDSERVVCVVNRAPTRPYYRAEIESVLSERLGDSLRTLVSEDPGLVQAAWDGNVPGRGPFKKSIRRLAAPIMDMVSGDD